MIPLLAFLIEKIQSGKKKDSKVVVRINIICKFVSAVQCRVTKLLFCTMGTVSRPVLDDLQGPEVHVGKYSDGQPSKPPRDKQISSSTLNSVF